MKPPTTLIRFTPQYSRVQTFYGLHWRVFDNRRGKTVAWCNDEGVARFLADRLNRTETLA